MSTRTLPAGVGLTMLERAIWQTVAYVDVFDYPLTPPEIQRYLEGIAAAPAEVEQALADGQLQPAYLARVGPFVMLPGREQLVEVRRRRAARAARLWPAARQYGRLIAALPFVRMVAVTGSLAVSNVDERADIDYLVVTENGRLWLCRAAVILVVRLAARRGVQLCPNYLLSERALAFQQKDLYTARELTQMVPLAGLPTYARLRQANAWADALLPNAGGPPPAAYASTTAAASLVADADDAVGRPLQRLAEWPLRSPAGGWLNQWEMRRKIRKFAARHPGHAETDFTADRCKGHVDSHAGRILHAYQQRLNAEARPNG